MIDVDLVIASLAVDLLDLVTLNYADVNLTALSLVDLTNLGLDAIDLAAVNVATVDHLDKVDVNLMNLAAPNSLSPLRSVHQT